MHFWRSLLPVAVDARASRPDCFLTFMHRFTCSSNNKSDSSCGLSFKMFFACLPSFLLSVLPAPWEWVEKFVDTIRQIRMLGGFGGVGWCVVHQHDPFHCPIVKLLWRDSADGQTGTPAMHLP